ncbi:hypothetical protein HJC23_010389 [Cyclotella cryptica]|uniref:Uncharacterized protein n=1 Tax=Cyclotella cryptica TaxID=29204 RepID=A0ABD3QIP2_9STRA
MTSYIRYAIFLWTCVQFDFRILAFSHVRRIGSSYYSHPSSPMPSQYVLHAVPWKDYPFCAEAFTEITDDIKHCSEISRPSAAVCARRLDKDISAREWMENIEQREGSIHGVGAYSVLRCDVSFPATCRETNHASNYDANFHWNVWGIDFHMDRLCSSYSMLLESQILVRPCSLNDTSGFEGQIQTSGNLIKALLDEAAKSLLEQNTTKQPDPINILESTELHGANRHRTLMLTLLWTPPKHDHITTSNVSRPTVRGHASFAGPSRPSIEDKMPQPISACLSIPKELTPEALALLPRRHVENTPNPTEASVGASAKISSWCRVRRPLEDPSIFKVPGMNVGEVLLVRNSSNAASSNFIESLEILEGLTSNVFVIYTDGTIRSAPATNVLPGYSRHLVMKALLKIDPQLAAYNGPKLIFEDSAPSVQDALAGLWSEVFVTSSIRLLTPVNRIVIPHVKTSHHDSPTEMTTLWQGDRVVQTTKIRSALFRIGLDESSSFRQLVDKFPTKS